jgi:L-asparagine transporter-like permease
LDYLLEAPEMQALSLAVHIPLVCFGIAFPAMVFFMDGLHLRTGDPAYKAAAKRWSKVMLILFALGVVLMLAFDATVTRVLGVALILAFIALGTFTIATPEYLSEEEGQE